MPIPAHVDINVDLPSMAVVETTTIRVRRSTHERLQKQAELTGQSVTQVLEEAADLLEEAKMLEGAEGAWQRAAELPPEILARYAADDEEWVRELELRPPSTGEV
jgi:hypothetical protein